MRNDMTTIFLQDFPNKFYVASYYKLLLVAQKSNSSGRFKLKPITINHLWFVVKILWTPLLMNQYLKLECRSVNN